MVYDCVRSGFNYTPFLLGNYAHRVFTRMYISTAMYIHAGILNIVACECSRFAASAALIVAGKCASLLFVVC